jgi:hypothetical protein
MMEYKVVETSTVTDEALEGILNDWTSRGWRLESIQFVVREASRRPAMAFVLFTREKQQVRQDEQDPSGC